MSDASDHEILLRGMCVPHHQVLEDSRRITPGAAAIDMTFMSCSPAHNLENLRKAVLPWLEQPQSWTISI